MSIYKHASHVAILCFSEGIRQSCGKGATRGESHLFHGFKAYFIAFYRAGLTPELL